MKIGTQHIAAGLGKCIFFQVGMAIILLGAIYPQGSFAQISELPIDSSSLHVRQFDDTALETLRNDPDFDYEEDPEKMSWWERFKYELMRLLFATEGGRTFWRIVGYAMAVIAFIGIILAILRIDIVKVFGRQKKDIDMGVELGEENIHELDFKELLERAIAQKDYRKGVRILYLETLKELTQADLIVWKVNKTNHEYLEELRNSPFFHAFSSLTSTFEYVWYGDFEIRADQFDEMVRTFRKFQANMTQTV